MTKSPAFNLDRPPGSSRIIHHPGQVLNFAKILPSRCDQTGISGFGDQHQETAAAPVSRGADLWEILPEQRLRARGPAVARVTAAGYFYPCHERCPKKENPSIWFDDVPRISQF